MTRHIVLIYNPHSGFFLGWKSAEIRQYFESVFHDYPDLDVSLIEFRRKRKKLQLPSLNKQKVDQIWIAGGDGTITSIAEAVSGYKVPIGILPGGSMNLLARDLGMSLDLKQAVEQLRSAVPVKIDTATINGRWILNICNIGISTNFTEMREQFRDYPGWIRWSLLIWYMIKSIFVYPVMMIELTAGKRRYKFKTRSVSISNNPLSRDSIILPARTRLNSGLLGIYVAKDRSAWSLPVLIFKLLVGNWMYDEDLTAFTTQSATIVPLHRRKLKVMIDGELYRIKKPLNFRLHPGSLTLLKPEGGQWP